MYKSETVIDMKREYTTLSINTIEIEPNCSILASSIACNPDVHNDGQDSDDSSSAKQ